MVLVMEVTWLVNFPPSGRKYILVPVHYSQVLISNLEGDEISGGLGSSVWMELHIPGWAIRTPCLLQSTKLRLSTPRREVSSQWM